MIDKQAVDECVLQPNTPPCHSLYPLEALDYEKFYSEEVLNVQGLSHGVPSWMVTGHTPCLNSPHASRNALGVRSTMTPRL